MASTIIAIYFLYILLILALFYLWAVGIWRAFLANPLLGILTFFFSAPAVIFGVLYVFFRYDAAKAIADYFDNGATP
jgi:hypothetical protein